MSEQPRKVIVAVHGIGDQIQYSTPQQVLARFCESFGAIAAVPLGNFHDQNGMLALTADYPPELQRFVFTEVYWAGVPRKVVEAGHELEGTQPWVRTLIGRVQHRALTREKLSPLNFKMIGQVLKEMLESISVLERVFYLTGRMGIFSFDLNRVLVDFLGDVQIVTEFRDQYREILGIFNAQLNAVFERYPDAEIYFVAHSEGTVITVLGLLEALCAPAPPGASAAVPAQPWLQNVRGLMTIGSPIDKHLILWPELFASFAAPLRRPEKPIAWRNYFDYGDPIGFEVSEARRRFVEPPAWQGVFHLDRSDDRGFSRYPFPGKAHNDYWKDPGVFGHFIHDVVLAGDPPPPKPAAAMKPPSSHWWTPVVSWLFPYLALLAILFCGVYVLDKAAFTYRFPTLRAPLGEVFSTVLGISLLVAGLTLMVRIPRLSRRWSWRLFGVAFFALSIAAFRALPVCPAFAATPGVGLVALSLLLAAVSWCLSVCKPAWGMRALLLPGIAAVSLYLGEFLSGAKDHGDLWPVFLAGALFVYLWWLVVLLFDLIFVWHRYIRRSGNLQYLKA